MNPCRWCTEFVHKPDAWDKDNSQCLDMGAWTDERGRRWSFTWHSKSLSQVLLCTKDQDEWDWMWVQDTASGEIFGSHRMWGTDGREGYALIELSSRIQDLMNERWEAALAACED